MTVALVVIFEPPLEGELQRMLAMWLKREEGRYKLGRVVVEVRKDRKVEHIS